MCVITWKLYFYFAIEDTMNGVLLFLCWIW